ncbi:MAG TPA: histidine phosphatase family protein [Dehalococcoidia bacterium]|nr:histidine phosphatase family protein [Dehalococcoidia bacterium]
MSTRILLVRHGETDSNAEGRSQGRREVPLNARGREQAASAARVVAAFAPVAIYASTTGRAQETAGAIAGACGLEVASDERLLELDQGDLDGLMPTEMREQAPDFLQRWATEDPADLQMPGGESLREAQHRMLDAVRAIAAAHDGETAVAVSHNLALKALLCAVLGVELVGFRAIRLDTASISAIEVLDDGTLILAALNGNCHL